MFNMCYVKQYSAAMYIIKNTGTGNGMRGTRGIGEML